MDYPALLRAEGEALLAAATRNLDAPVPSCPGWDCRRLVSHTGRLLHSTATHLPRGVTTPPDRVDRPPTDDAELVAYYRRMLDATLSAFASVDPAAPAWNFTYAPAVAGFWHRRLANEFQIHAWDAADAVGERRALDPAFAADGVDELLTILLPPARAADSSAQADGSAQAHGTVHVHLTDVPGEWLVRLDGATVKVTNEHAKGDAALRGPAEPVLLALWGRAGLDASGLDAFGDTDLLLALRTGR